jgi:uncharacterized protein (TIGR00730 family)
VRLTAESAKIFAKYAEIIFFYGRLEQIVLFLLKEFFFMQKIITVFGSSIPQHGEEQYSAAEKLGELLALKGFDVCSGGNFGTMEAVSKGAVRNGAKAIGITLNSAGFTSNKYLTEEIICSSLFDRITKLIQYGNGYVILQGGTGTLLELSSVWELMNKDLLSVKPIACHSSMWKEIVNVMNDQLRKESRLTDLVKCFHSVEDIVEFLSETLFNR